MPYYLRRLTSGNFAVVAQATRKAVAIVGSVAEGRAKIDELTNPAPPPEADEVDMQFVSWVAELIAEHGSVDAARYHYSQINEFWDGETEVAAHHLAEFNAAVPFALRQNMLIGGSRA